MNVREQIQSVNLALSGTFHAYRIFAKKNGLNYNELIVLYTLDDFGSCTPKQICEFWAIPKQTVNGILRDFERNGYLCITSETEDKRKRILSFTKKGKEFARPILCKLHGLEELAMESLGEALCLQMVQCHTLYCKLLTQEIDKT